VSGDVLGWDSLGALLESFLVARLFFGCEFTLGMSEEICAIAAQSEHQEQLGVHARRANPGCGEAVDGGYEGVLKKHKTIGTYETFVNLRVLGGSGPSSRLP